MYNNVQNIKSVFNLATRMIKFYTTSLILMRLTSSGIIIFIIIIIIMLESYHLKSSQRQRQVEKCKKKTVS